MDDRDATTSELEVERRRLEVESRRLGHMIEIADDFREWAEHLKACLDERDRFLVEKGLWIEFVESIRGKGEAMGKCPGR